MQSLRTRQSQVSGEPLRIRLVIAIFPRVLLAMGDAALLCPFDNGTVRQPWTCYQDRSTSETHHQLISVDYLLSSNRRISSEVKPVINLFQLEESGSLPKEYSNLSPRSSTYWGFFSKNSSSQSKVPSSGTATGKMTSYFPSWQTAAENASHAPCISALPCCFHARDSGKICTINS